MMLWPMVMHHHNKFADTKGATVQEILSHWSFSDHDPINLSFFFKCVTRQQDTLVPLMMMHHHAQFDYKRLSSLEDIIRTKSCTHGQTGAAIPIYTQPASPQLHYGGYNKCIKFNLISTLECHVIDLLSTASDKPK